MLMVKKLKIGDFQKLQIFDLLQLSRAEREALQRARLAIAEYKIMRRARMCAFSDYMSRLPANSAAQAS
jgi:hypothetical protein